MSRQCDVTPDGGADGFASEPATDSAFFIGKIETVVGSCTLSRSSDSAVQIKPGDPVCEGDTIQTAAGGKVCIRFIDGTVFNLSDSARMVLREFAGDVASPSAQFDVSNGTFAFIAGEMAKTGRLNIDTPFASIRGRSRAGGVGTLSLASLFFAAMEEVHAKTPALSFLDDGVINFKESEDYKDAIRDGKFGTVELTVKAAQPYTTYLNDPGDTIVLRPIGSSVSESHIPNSLVQMLGFANDQQQVLQVAAQGQGPTGFGNGGSSTPPPLPPELAPQPINTFVPQPPPFLPPNGGSSGSTSTALDFVPTPEAPPPPVPPTVTATPTAVNVTDNHATITFTFTVAPTDFVLADTSVTGGALSAFAMVDATHYTAVFTATPGIQINNASVGVIASSYHDINGNVGLGGSTAFTVDTLAPGVTIGTSPDVSVLKIGDVAHLTFTLSEAATNFVLTDIAVTGGTLSNFAGSGANYTADFTPDPRSTTAATVNVAGGTFTDAADNGNTPAPPFIMPVDTVSAAIWSISGDSSVTEGGTAGYTVHLAGTLQAGQTATIDLAVADIDTTGADYASFVTAVNTAIIGRSDLSFDGTKLTYTADGTNPMADLVISLGAVNDGLVEGPESYKVVLSNPDTTKASDITLGTSEAITTITDANTATWSLTGDTGVTEGSNASYTVHLAGTLQAGETATIHLALTDGTTTSADHANFAAAVQAAVTAYNANGPASGTLSYVGDLLTFTSDGTGTTPGTMSDLVISLGAVNDGLVEGPESYTVALSNPGTTTNAPIALDAANSAITTITDANTATWSLTGDTGVTEGSNASYTVHLAGTLQAGETATIHLALTDGTTTSADHANFAAAVQAAVTAYNANGPASGTLSYVGDLLTFTSDGTGTTPGTMSDLVISLGAVNDGLVEGPESYTVALSNPGTTTNAPIALDAANSAITTITDANTATWSLTGDTGVTEGSNASYTVHLAGTLQAGETATIHLALTDGTTTSADHANFAAAVQAAVTAYNANGPASGTLSYVGDLLTFTSDGTGTTPGTMSDLVISLGAVNDGLVEGPESYTVALSNPGTTTNAPIALDAANSAITTITDANTATWSLTGDTGVTEGSNASYTVHLAGTLQAGETATIHLALTDGTTTSADHANFAAAVQAAVTAYNANGPASGTLSYVGDLLTFTSDGTGTTPGTMSDLVISLGAVNDGLVEGPESYTVALSNPGTTTNAPIALDAANSAITTITDANTATWSLTGDTGVTEGSNASYTVHLAGTLQAGETATIHLALTDGTTTSADHANFAAAVQAAVTAYNANGPASGTLSYVGDLLTFTSDGTGTTPGTMSDLVINLGTVNDNLLEANEQYTVSLSSPASTTGANVVGTGTVTTTIIDNDPAAGAAITLEVDEAALLTGSNPSLTTETDNTPSLPFSAAGFNLVSFAFSNDISGLVKDLNIDGAQDIFWVRDSGTQISGYLDAAHTVLADRLTLSAPSSIAADTTGSVTVTETLSAALKNPLQ